MSRRECTCSSARRTRSPTRRLRELGYMDTPRMDPKTWMDTYEATTKHLTTVTVKYQTDEPSGSSPVQGHPFSDPEVYTSGARSGLDERRTHRQAVRSAKRTLVDPSENGEACSPKDSTVRFAVPSVGALQRTPQDRREGVTSETESLQRTEGKGRGDCGVGGATAPTESRPEHSFMASEKGRGDVGAVSNMMEGVTLDGVAGTLGAAEV